MLPIITIVTPSYNQARFIKETIESILKQNYPSLEYIVIDGGSTDGSKEIIRNYENQLAFWCSEKDEGQSDAIMKGFNRCSGELIAWVNSDDVLFPGCLNAAAKCFLENGYPDIITANIAYIDAKSNITRFIRVPRQSRFFFFRGVWHGTAPCVFFKRSLFVKVGGVQKKYKLSMDLDLWVRMMKAGARVVHITSYLGGYRWHKSSKTVRSITNRSTQENHETTEILNEHLHGSTPLTRAFWRITYKIYQTINFNYIIAYNDLKKT